MSIAKRVNEARSTIILIVFVLVSIASLAAGTEASIIGGGIRTTVSVITDPFMLALSATRGAGDYARGFVFNYVQAREEAEALRQELARLSLEHAALAESAEENERLRDLLDFRDNEPRLTLRGAQVIGRDRNLIKLDAGSMAGVEPGMCVMTKDGFVGVVTTVQPLTSNVATLLHPDCKVGVRVKRTRGRGIVTGTGDISPFARLQYVSESEDLRADDVLVTSEGSFFPSGYAVGTVERVEDSQAILKTARVRPAADPRAVDEVFIVRAAHPPAEVLAGMPQPQRSSAPAETAPALPDQRTLQERYAP